MSSSESFPLAPVPASLFEQLATMPDPRIERTNHHGLIDILAITLLVGLCGADNFTEIAQVGRTDDGLRTMNRLSYQPMPHSRLRAENVT